MKVLTDPESVKEKLKDNRSIPRIEVFRSQVAPFDVLPFMKANHWSTLSLELRSNREDYSGVFRTAPVTLLGLPQEIVYRRDARLIKDQRARLGIQLFLPLIPKELNLELIKRDTIRADENWPANLRVLQEHQMLILFLTKESNDSYAAWNRFQALYPVSVDRSDLQAIDQLRYYRLVLPLKPESPPLSWHPLTWTTMSHVVWDGMSPEVLSSAQQEAMLDWLHWGGQLILVGGSAPSFSLLKDSFLSPYLPADDSGETFPLKDADLKALSDEYPPPHDPVRRNDEPFTSSFMDMEDEPISNRYGPPVPIKTSTSRPLYFMALHPHADSTVISLGASSKRFLGVERRVGRGRVLMLAFNPTDPPLASWAGLDTLLRRVILRRPEESAANLSSESNRPSITTPNLLPGPALSWLRLLTRDLEGPQGPTTRRESTNERKGTSKRSTEHDQKKKAEFVLDNTRFLASETSVAQWNDRSGVPRLCREMLQEASGIKIPTSLFIFSVIITYIFLLIPINFLFCRYLLRRSEVVWLGVPLISIAFAVVVERAAAFDLGYNSACDEINILELYDRYQRAHVTRFASLYSTGRSRFNISFPNDPTALALPLDQEHSLRGEDIVTSTWQSQPVPVLEGFLVQPRSLGMFRSEQVTSQRGAISLVEKNGKRHIVNDAFLELHDAVLVDVSSTDPDRATYLGTIQPGQTVEVKIAGRPDDTLGTNVFRPGRLLSALGNFHEDRPENQGELRLVAWAPRPVPGPLIEPKVDRHRGISVVVVHLRMSPAPSPEGPIYNSAPRQHPTNQSHTHPSPRVPLNLFTRGNLWPDARRFPRTIENRAGSLKTISQKQDN
ncbi:MAG: hypothetical protein NVSMB9_19190 [Isosphaeraceae bacterium]